MKLLKPLFLIALFFCLLSVRTAASAEKKFDWFVCKNSEIKFDDGDSFFCGSEEIRMLGIDTPEIIHERHGIFIDQPYGKKAAAFTKKQFERAKRIVIIRGGRGGYGRTLAHVLLDGELLGVKLIKAGLAYENIGRYGDNGLPEFALQITEAARSSPRPNFEDPHAWRQKNQKKVK